MTSISPRESRGDSFGMLAPVVLTCESRLLFFGWRRLRSRRQNSVGGAIRRSWIMMNVGYMLIPVVLFVGGIFASSALFSLGMTRVEE